MSWRFATIDDYTAAYRDGKETPTSIAIRALDAVARSERLDPPMRVFISQSRDDVMRQAQAATGRYQSGKPLSAVDGVPIAVKDEVDQRGYPTTVGTAFMGTEPARDDCTVVARLRAAGALLIGKVNMHEIGLGVTGINPHHGTARNPYAPDHATGGSSSGSGAAVAAGFCPVAIGADGGGSVRIPASLCGVTGIKATYGRVPGTGAAPICWSLGHIGPLAATLADAAKVLEIIAGPDPGIPDTLGQPSLSFGGLLGDGGAQPDISGLRVGWCDAWAEQAEPHIARACQAAVQQLVRCGAELVSLDIDHLDVVAPVQYVTIGVEMAASQFEMRREHKRDYGADVRLMLELASHVPGVDYVRAQRVRSQIASAFNNALREVDVIATPTTGRCAPPLRADALKSGENDEQVLSALTAFAFAANLTGLPALTVPVGYDEIGLPIGLQLIGRAWDEPTIVRAGLVAEAHCQRRRPRVHYRLLD